MNVSSVLQQSFLQLENRLQQSAARISSYTTRDDADTVNLGATSVAILSANSEYATNLGAMQKNLEARRSTLNIMA